MPPNAESSVLTGVLNEDDEEVINWKAQQPQIRVYKLVWLNIILFGYLHAAAIYGLYLAVTAAKWATLGQAFILAHLAGFGITAGVHRLWAHRAYKAKWPLRLILCICNTLAFEDAVIHWARDHRVHHKYSETDADPHSASRGFFFSHMGWLMCKKHPEVAEKGKHIDISDLEADPILAFQRKYYNIVMPLIAFILPTVVPMVLWNESFVNAYCVNLARYTYCLHSTWLVNSAAHFFGNRPYDKFISPCENNLVKIMALGEGFHNFHHTFPWDYKTSELGNYTMNFSTAFIDFFAKIGWAYDLRSVSPEFVKKRVLRTGDGSHDVWGWGDPDQTQEDRDGTIVTHKQE